MSDPIMTLVKQGLDQGFRADDLLVILADANCDVGQRLKEQGMPAVEGTIYAVIPKTNFGPAFPDAPNALRDQLHDKPAKGSVHAVQVDAAGSWALGEVPLT